VRLGIAGFRVFVRRRQTFLKKWSQSRVLGFYEALFAIMEAAFMQNVIWKALENADPAV